jgi:thiol-disulfide isomerase/thioredoxin
LFHMKLRNIGVLILIVILAGLAVYRDSGNRDQQVVLPSEFAPKPGFLAPGFDLTALDGSSYKVGGNREKPLLLNFWASWCGPCEEEAPMLTEVYEKYKDRLDLYAVNVTGNDDFDQAKAFAERFKFGFPVLLDYKLDAVKLYRFQVIPTSFLINRNGVVVDVINLPDQKELEKKIRKLIDG